jgi:hypothetical protein
MGGPRRIPFCGKKNEFRIVPPPPAPLLMRRTQGAFSHVTTELLVLPRYLFDKQLASLRDHLLAELDHKVATIRQVDGFSKVPLDIIERNAFLLKSAAYAKETGTRIEFFIFYFLNCLISRMEK